jgi:hypothetical protein
MRKSDRDFCRLSVLGLIASVASDLIVAARQSGFSAFCVSIWDWRESGRPLLRLVSSASRRR